MISHASSVRSGRLFVVAAVLLNLPAPAGAEIANRYVKAKDGQPAKPIVAVDNVCAWPNLTLLGDGTIIATIFNRPSHGSMAGDVDCYASEDGGRTWQKRGTPAPHEPDTNRMNVAAGLTANGDLIVLASGWSNRYPPGKEGPPFRESILAPWVCRSSDGARTWSVDKQAFPAKGPRGGDCIPFGDVLAGKDGMLRAAIYEVVNRRDDRVWIYRSPDDGKTWEQPAALDPNAYRNETALVHLGGGKWLAAARVSELQLYASDDDAKTWQPRGALTEASQHPGHFFRLRDGGILLSYGNRTANRGVDVRVSRDEGKTWSEPWRVVDWQGDGGYPSSVQLPGGEIVTAYYAAKIEGHPAYHMGAVLWDPATSLDDKGHSQGHK